MSEAKLQFYDFEGKRSEEGELDLKDRDYPHLVALEINTEGTRAISVHSDRRESGRCFIAKISKLWELCNGRAGECLDVFVHPMTPFYSWNMIGSDGTQFLSGSVDFEGVVKETFLKSEIKIWSFKALEKEATVRTLDTAVCMRAHNYAAPFLDFKAETTQDGSRALFLSQEGDAGNFLEFWSLTENQSIQRFRIGNKNIIQRVKLSPDGRWALTYCMMCEKEPLELWDLSTGKCLHKIDSHCNRTLHGLTVSADWTHAYCLLEGGGELFLKVVDLLNPEKSYEVDHFPMSKDMYSIPFQLTPDGMKLISTDSLNLSVWNCAPLPHERLIYLLSQYVKLVLDEKDGWLELEWDDATKSFTTEAHAEIESLLEQVQKSENPAYYSRVLEWIKTSGFQAELEQYLFPIQESPLKRQRTDANPSSGA